MQKKRFPIVKRILLCKKKIKQLWCIDFYLELLYCNSAANQTGPL